MGKGRSILRRLKRSVGSSSVDDSAPNPPLIVEQTATSEALAQAVDQNATGLESPSSTDVNELPTLPSDVWLLAEEKLRTNAKKAKIFDAYIEILEARLGKDRKDLTIAALRTKVKELLEAKSQELEQSAFAAHTNTLKNMLFVRELINSISTLSPPAAIAGAGVCLVLSLLVQATEQQNKLLDGLKAASAVICRVNTIQRVYYITSWGHSRTPADIPPLTEEFRSSMISLCSKVLEFQARALCYMKKHEVIRIAGDMFKHNAWDILLQDITAAEDTLFRFTAIIDSTVIQSALHEQDASIRRLQRGLDNVIDQWNSQAERKRKMISILQTLYTCPYADRKDRNREHVEGTCKWFTDHLKFREWRETGNLLWVSADPGCGKSVLAKYLIDAVLPGPDRIVSYFFFKDDFVDQRSSANAICAVLRQLIMQRPTSLEDFILDYMLSDGPELRNSFSNLWAYYLRIVRQVNVGEVLCVFDALDECRESDRHELMHALKDLQKLSKKTKLKILITSRPYAHLRREFQEMELKIPVIHLSGEAEVEANQISAEINLVINSRIEEISRKWELELDESRFLREQLSEIPNRTYLWVQLTMDVIENAPQFTRGNVRRAITNLPTTVDEAYEKILERSLDAKKAERLLRIVTAAVRPLTLDELSFSLAIEESHLRMADVAEEMEPESRFRVTVRDLCGLFVVVMDRKVYLLHQTAREFLVRSDRLQVAANEGPQTAAEGMRWKHSLATIDSHRLLFKICLWTFKIDEKEKTGLGIYVPSRERSLKSTFNYLKGSDLVPPDYLKEPYSVSSDTSFDSDLASAPSKSSSNCLRSTPVPFFNYADSNWAEHVNHAKISKDDELAKKALERCYALIGRMKIIYQVPQLPPASLALLLATSLGLIIIMDILLEEGADIETRVPHEADPKLSVFTTGAGATALDMAVANQRIDAVCLLLSSGANTLGGQTAGGYCPLQVAAANGSTRIARLLLQHQADVDAARHGNTTPLFCALVNKHEEMIELLLANGAKVNERNEQNETVTMCAIRAGHDGIFRQFLALSTDLEERNDSGETALLLAAKLGRASMLKALFSRGADITAADSHGRNVLALGIVSGDAETVISILDQRFDPNSFDNKGRTPLDLAIESNSIAIIDTLLARGAHVDPRDKDGKTPLSLAVRQGNINVARMLLKHGAMVDAKDNRGWSPLGHAVICKFENIVNLLWIYEAELSHSESERLDFWTGCWYELMRKRQSRRSRYLEEQKRQRVLEQDDGSLNGDDEQTTDLMSSRVDEDLLYISRA